VCEKKPDGGIPRLAAEPAVFRFFRVSPGQPGRRSYRPGIRERGRSSASRYPLTQATRSRIKNGFRPGLLSGIRDVTGKVHATGTELLPASCFFRQQTPRGGFPSAFAHKSNTASPRPQSPNGIRPLSGPIHSQKTGAPCDVPARKRTMFCVNDSSVLPTTSGAAQRLHGRRNDFVSPPRSETSGRCPGERHRARSCEERR